MQTQLKQKLALVFLGLLLSAHSAIAKTDLEAQENYAKAIAKNRQQETDHSAHANHIDKTKEKQKEIVVLQKLNLAC